MDICSRNEKLAIRRPAILVALALLLCSCKSTPPESMVTPPAGSKPPATTQQSSQPMRGIWLATVSRLDWPPVSSVNISNPTSRARVQQQAMIDKLDHLQRLGINTVFFQVKPDGTALWPSKILPWSDLMTGKIGENPGYDPLQFMLDEAHKRGMKVHAWFNPYRVSVNTKPGTIRELNSTLSQQQATWQIFIGKAVPALIVATFQATIVLAIGIWAYQIPFAGSLALFYFTMVIYGLSLVGFGLLISSLCSTQQQAFIGVFVFMMPAILLSGYVSPVENMPVWLQNLTWINPIRHFTDITKQIYLKDASLDIVWNSLWPLLVITATTGSAAYAMFRRKVM